jgi:catechol 2,3-dioxygenase-like lactoylglutathione lyase family enzyme
MRVSPLESVRLSVSNLAAARHYWESAMGFACTGETSVDDPTLRRIWGTEGGEMRAARLERPGSTKLELFHWEGCTGEPVRDARRPWDYGVAELVFATARGERNGEIFITPFGERCRFAREESVVLSVAPGEDCGAFFGDFLGWSQREKSGVDMKDAASISACDVHAYQGVDAAQFTRLADPRAAVATADRMSPAYTGVWMLTASVVAHSPETMLVEVPFIGRRRAVVTRAPGGVRFGVFEKELVYP